MGAQRGGGGQEGVALQGAHPRPEGFSPAKGRKAARGKKERFMGSGLSFAEGRGVEPPPKDHTCYSTSEAGPADIRGSILNS